MATLYDMSAEDLKKLYGLKTSFATADDATKKLLSQQATALRSQYGLTSDTADADTVGKIIAQKLPIQGNTTAQQLPMQGSTPQITPYQSMPQQGTQQRIDPIGDNRINELANAQRAQAQSALMNVRNQGQSALNAEKRTIAPRYYEDRNAISSQANIQAKRLAEMMARSGLSGSGASGELQQRNMGALQGNLAQSQMAESNALANIDARATDLENQYQTGLASANSQAEIARIQSLINQANTNRNFELSQSNVTGMYQGAPTQATSMNTANDALNRELSTIDRYSQDYMAEILRRRATADTTDDALIPYLESARAQKIANQNTANQPMQLTSSSAAIDLWQQLGVANQAISRALGIPEGTRYTGQVSSGSSGSATTSGNIKPYTDIINKSFVTSKGFDETGLRKYLTGLSASGIDDATVLQIAQIYGISAPQQQPTPSIPKPRTTISPLTQVY